MGRKYRTLEEHIIHALNLVRMHRKCVTLGCDKWQQWGHMLCPMHLSRYRRGKEPIKGKHTTTSHGYILEYWADGHALLDNKPGSLYQHRRVLYVKIGPGPRLTCHWCSTPVDWATLHPDHINGVRDDNRPENLVPACQPCNQQRGNMQAFLRRCLPAVRQESFGGIL